MSRVHLSERQVLVGLVLLALAMGAGKALWPDLVPVSALTIPAVIGGWRLSPRSLAILAGVILVVLVGEVLASPVTRTALAAGVVLFVVAIGFRYSVLRQRWGLTATQGMPLVLELRARVRAMGEPPPLEDGWVLTRALRSVGEQAFRGDFALARRDGPLVHAMVVDVSGHGTPAAGRAAQLAGAFGGLIQVLAADAVMPACNDYLVRQEWDHDYATAAHVVLDQATGRGRVTCAGHPPPQLRRADGRWEEVAARGRVLGLAAPVSYDPAPFALAPGDAIVLVSDGALDETRDDPWDGVHAFVQGWLAGGARAGTLPLPRLDTPVDDDQSVVVLHRADPTSGGVATR